MADEPTHRPLLDIDVTTGAQAVLALRGDLDPHTAPLLEAALDDLLANGDVDGVAIDLAGISFIDSSGLRVFVTARESLAQQGASLTLRNPTANARRLLDITGLGEIIAVE